MPQKSEWVLRTNTGLSTEEVVRVYKDLWRVERVFRDLKDVLRLRPVYHWKADRVRGHIFVCFLALYLIQYLGALLGDEGCEVGKLMKALRGLKVADIELEGRRYRVRTRVGKGIERQLGQIGLKLPLLIKAKDK